MLYKYKYNERCDYFKKDQEKRKVIRRYYRHNCVGKSGLSIKSYLSYWKIYIGNK